MESIKSWFKAHARQLPWRQTADPYHIWISEVMLQQTQVAVVIPYFERWIRRFPTVEALATASLDEVIKLWEGLGYYSRARNLHAGARQIVETFGGKLPNNKEALSSIKGIGPYTQGAILSFAFHQKAAAVDGNVRRVIARYTGSEAEMEATVEALLPEDEPWVVMEGLIELGATICTKKPQCASCPLRRECYAYRHQVIEHLPSKKVRPKVTLLKRSVAIIVCNAHYLLRKETKGVMKDLFEFPYLEYQENAHQAFEQELGLELKQLRTLGMERQTFTRYRAELFPYLFEAKACAPEHLWKSREELDTLPFSSGHRRIVASL